MGPDSSGQETSRSVFLNQTKLEANFEAAVLLSKATRKLEIENLAEVQFVIDSCWNVSQSNYLNNSNKKCDWLILACCIREQMHADTTFLRLENKVCFKHIS